VGQPCGFAHQPHPNAAGVASPLSRRGRADDGEASARPPEVIEQVASRSGIATRRDEQRANRVGIVRSVTGMRESMARMAVVSRALVIVALMAIMVTIACFEPSRAHTEEPLTDFGITETTSCTPDPDCVNLATRGASPSTNLGHDCTGVALGHSATQETTGGLRPSDEASTLCEVSRPTLGVWRI